VELAERILSAVFAVSAVKRGVGMPKKIKLKTHRGAAKRFKRTKRGKFLRGKAFKQHILSSKTTKRKRGLRGTTTVAAVDTPKLARMLPYK
jgi:large subunit ribosomal protein L35